VPGASALLAALVVSGLPSDRFAFEGFLPKRAGRRNKRLRALVNETRTMVFCEAARRVVRLLNEIHEVLGDRPVVICRELTKKYEEIIRGRVSELLAKLEGRELKGEVVVVVGGYEERDEE
jgi:16S rRNA (cytidine1402-2'-O)-methyltransferase